MSTMTQPLLSISNLQIEFDTPSGAVRVVDGVSFEVAQDEVVCVVGESGSGKTQTMLAVMGLLAGAASITGGTVHFRGTPLATMTGSERRQMRGKRVAMIFQDPMTSLNPVMRIGKQIEEMIAVHQRGLSRAARRARSIELLGLVRIPNPVAAYKAYPHELSGGMRQRVMIAIAMAHDPDVLIADEPTTALDVTVQAQILAVLREMRARVGSSMVLITHDLGVVAETADRVVVMYAGAVVEAGSVEQIFDAPRHPYTAALLASSLRLDAPVDDVHAIAGQPPTPGAQRGGCAFLPRCTLARGRHRCAERTPPLISIDDGVHMTACHFADEVGGLRVSDDMPSLDDRASV